jgi:hypothetical protein
MARYIRGTETDKWLPQYLRKCTFPIFNQPARTSDDMIGAAFLLFYNNIPYIISAKHVINIDDPVIGFAKKDATVIGIKSSAFEKVGLRWISHPADLDIAAIPFHLPLNLVKGLDVKVIPVEMWVDQPRVKINNIVAHLGYPLKDHTIYTNGSPSPFPIAMPGVITNFEKLNIETKTAGAHGASGGPLFMKGEDDKPYLIGIAIETKMYGKSNNIKESNYSDITKSIRISLIKDILESSEMLEQYKNRIVDESWL